VAYTSDGYTPGSGAQIGVDRIGGIDYQREKASWGPEGSVTDADHAIAKGLPIQNAPCSHYHAITATGTNAASIKGSAGKLRSVHAFNKADYPIYYKFHDTAGTPTPGAGVVMTVGVQAGQRVDFVPAGPRSFVNGIGVSAVLNHADNDTTAVAANDGSLEVFYE
jgi:hypothetical protein